MLDCSVAEAQDVGPHTEHHLHCRNMIATVYSYVILKRSDFRCIIIHMTLRCVYMEVCADWRYAQIGGMHATYIPLANYTIPFRLQGYKQ